MKGFLLAVLCFVSITGYAEDEINPYSGLISELKIKTEENAYWNENGEYIQELRRIEFEIVFLNIRDGKKWFMYSPGFYSRNEHTYYDGPGGISLFFKVLQLFHSEKNLVLINGIEKNGFEILIRDVIFVFMESEDSGLFYELNLDNPESVPESEQKELPLEDFESDET